MIRKNSMKSEQGFTLVEVLASLTIISIILIGSYNLIIFTNQAAVSNSDRLVAINLGKAVLERLRIDKENYFVLPKSEEESAYEHFNVTLKDDEPFNEIVNNKTYQISLKINQTVNKYRFFDITVIVELKEENIKHQLEGTVNYGLEE